MDYNYRYIVDSEDHQSQLASKLNLILRNIDERLDELEYKNSKLGKKPDISRAEMSALLHELGIMEFLLSTKIHKRN